MCHLAVPAVEGSYFDMSDNCGLFVCVCLYVIIIGVPIVHLITYPFPNVWHRPSDNAGAINWTFVSNFRKILTVFLHEYFHLQ